MARIVIHLRAMNEFRRWTHVNLLELARTSGHAQGEAELRDFPRLWPELLPGSPQQVTWRVEAQWRHSAATQALWMRLMLRAQVEVSCQSCLAPMTVALDVDRWFRFVETEAEAEAEDEDSEEDVLAQPQDFDVFALVEDELLLALPLVPRHGGCIAQYQDQDPPEALDEPPLHPFAALAALKKPD